jgi:hypothetical protein
MSRGELGRFHELESYRNTWYCEYWYERDHWPGFGCLIGRVTCNLFRKLGELARHSSTVTNRSWAPRGLSVLHEADEAIRISGRVPVRVFVKN